MEIERKWLLKHKPHIKFTDRHIIFQSYLATGDIEVRIRKAIRDDSVGDVRTGYVMSPHKLTVKVKGSLSRPEVEMTITAQQYEELLEMLDKQPIIKDYYIAHHCDHRIEVSQVDNDWWYMEIEFDSEEEANEFVMPDELSACIDKEVTTDPAYKMKNYWTATR